MKKRSIFVIILLSILTLGLYDLYWFVVFHGEVRAKTGKGASTILHILGLLFTFGLYPLYWIYVTSKRMSEACGNTSIDVQLFLGIIMFPIRLSPTDRAIVALLTGGVILLQSQANEMA